jgi:hypothetical protein
MPQYPPIESAPEITLLEHDRASVAWQAIWTVNNIRLAHLKARAEGKTVSVERDEAKFMETLQASISTLERKRKERQRKREEVLSVQLLVSQCFDALIACHHTPADPDSTQETPASML